MIKNKGLRINNGKRRHTKVRNTNDDKSADVIISLESENNSKMVLGTRARKDNEPTTKITIRLSASQTKDLDVTTRITYKRPHNYFFARNSLFSKFKHNVFFRDAVMSGAYFYYNNKLCLYRSDSLKFHGARVEYADSVKVHPEMYLLSLTKIVPVSRNSLYLRKHKKIKHGKRMYHSKSVNGYPAKLNKENVPKVEVVCHASEYCSEINKAETILLHAREEIVSKVMEFVNRGGDGGGGGHQDSFCAYFTWLMDEKYNVSKKDLSDMTGIDIRTITRMRTECDYKPSLEYILACCVALSLLPWECDYLLYLAGYALRLVNKVERAYIAIIHVFAIDCSLMECNEILDEMGVTNLSDIIKKNKKTN